MDSLDVAAAYYREAIRRGVRYYEPAPLHRRLAEIYLYQGLYEDAIEQLLRSIHLKPHDPLNHIWLGVAYTALGRYEQAVEEVMTATELVPDFAFYRIFHSLLLCRMGREEEGQAQLRLLAESLEGASWQNSVIGFLTGEPDEATLLRLAESDDPETDLGQRCEAYYYIGMAYMLDTDADLESSHPDTAKTRTYLERCVGTGLRRFAEHGFAQAELAQIQGD
jgi:tetratricopeptide (TPR) repeat protein